LQLARQLASSGFRDTSRVGGGNPELGVMMARYNREALLRSLQSYRHSLDRLMECIEREDWQALEEILQATRSERSHFASCKKPS
jgi:arogenate dehydrogenase (NADP+)